MNKEIADALNCIIEFLAVRDLAQMSKDALKKACGASKADVIIALGSDLPRQLVNFTRQDTERN